MELLSRIQAAGQDVAAIIADIRLVMERARVQQDEEEGQRRNDDRRDEKERQQWEREREIRRRKMEEIEVRRQEERDNRERVLRDWAARVQAAAERQRQELAVVRPAEDEGREEEAQGNDVPGVEEGGDEAAEQGGRAQRLPTHLYNNNNTVLINLTKAVETFTDGFEKKEFSKRGPYKRQKKTLEGTES
ncbi:unnamed protein product [Allacma fusca]|uniref:Uncharacterized protein n=1 Tax=Allacma fusca TaxID=39272 RepID=A0A8J2NU97_9HEXA|nr:unnamed protein product [Allacma fusca]